MTDTTRANIFKIFNVLFLLIPHLNSFLLPSGVRSPFNKVAVCRLLSAKMPIVETQKHTFLRLMEQLSPFLRNDQGLLYRIQATLASQRAFGSRDRRLYRELIFTSIRYLPWIEPVIKSSPEEAVRRVAWLASGEIPVINSFREAFATGPRVSGNFRELLPEWLEPHCPDIFKAEQLDCVLSRAPLWIRIQGDEDKIRALLASDDIVVQQSPILKTALRLTEDANIMKNRAYLDGLVEVQDLGSQLLLESIGVQAGGRWLDCCAGAGGKSLQLARLLGSSGRVVAWDIRPAALTELNTRATRAGIRNIKVSSTAPQSGEYDGVLVDAPCSGSGTFRRSPHLKWTLTEADVLKASKLQTELLDCYASRVRNGGRLVYATCSLSKFENDAVAAEFLKRHPDFKPAPFANTFGFLPSADGGLTILPAAHDTDGFFVASWIRK
jgi:16S rRNA (cytosine967-C5)-methyltransferase